MANPVMAGTFTNRRIERSKSSTKINSSLKHDLYTKLQKPELVKKVGAELIWRDH
jgi:hypothetical protein